MQFFLKFLFLFFIFCLSSDHVFVYHSICNQSIKLRKKISGFLKMFFFKKKIIMTMMMIKWKLIEWIIIEYFEDQERDSEKKFDEKKDKQLKYIDHNNYIIARIFVIFFWIGSRIIVAIVFSIVCLLYVCVTVCIYTTHWWLFFIDVK